MCIVPTNWFQHMLDKMKYFLATFNLGSLFKVFKITTLWLYDQVVLNAPINVGGKLTWATLFV